MKKSLRSQYGPLLYSLTIILVVCSLLFSPLAGLGSRAHAQGNDSGVPSTGVVSVALDNDANTEPTSSPILQSSESPQDNGSTNNQTTPTLEATPTPAEEPESAPILEPTQSPTDEPTPTSILESTPTPTLELSPTPTGEAAPMPTPTNTPENQDGTSPIVPSGISGIQVPKVTTTWATIVWSTDSPADTMVNYGTSAGLGLTISDAGLATNHSVLLGGLDPGTTYYFEVQSTYYLSNTVTDNNGGSYYSFTTLISETTPSATPSPEVKQVEPLKATFSVSPGNRTELTSLSGKIRVNIPAGAASENLRVDFAEETPSGSTGMQIINQFDLNAYAVDRANAKVSKFQKDLPITIQNTPDDLRGLDVDSLGLYYLDEANKQWVSVPSTYDPKTMTLTATINHFSKYGEQATPVISGPGRIMNFQVNPYSGTASSSYPIEVPPGAGGLQPKIELVYNSGAVDEMKNKRSVGSWVGIGWTLNLGCINYDDLGNKTYLNFSNENYLLVQDPGNSSVYHTVQETFYKITRSGQTWNVYDRDGIYYRFGGSTTSQQYYQNGGNTTYYRWDLDLIQDTHQTPNKISISYNQDKWTYNGNTSVRSAYPQYVNYNFDDKGNPRGQIIFNTTLGNGTKDATWGYLRPDNPGNATYFPGNITTYPPPKVVENGSLNSIEVKSNYQLVRKYNFTYSNSTSYISYDYGSTIPISYSGNFTLTSVTQVGADGSSTLPTTTFAYTGLQTYLSDNQQGHDTYTGNPGNPASFNWPHLTSVTNGYGGNISFSYTQKGNGTYNLWSREVVTSKIINPGSGTSQTYQYSYAGNPQYYPSDAASCWTAEFRGFSQGNETDAAGQTIQHQYWTTGSTQSEYFTGKEKYTEWDNAAGQPLKSSGYTWGNVSTLGNNLAYFVRLEQGNTTIYSVPSGATKTTQTRYSYDSYGNVITEYQDGDIDTSADDATVWRAFSVNTSANILGKPYRERIYAGNVSTDDGTNRKSETLYYYDNLANGQPPTKGDLTKVEHKTDASTSSSISYGYDNYGNMVNETDPMGNITYYSYDSTYHALPVSTQYPIIGSESYAWYYGSGKIGNDTNVNAKTTSYYYDTFWRLNTVVKPDDSIGSPSIIYQYNNWGTINSQRLTTLTKLAAGNYTWKSEYFDGLGRVVQTQSQGDYSGGTTVIDSTTTYNNRGLVDRVYVSQVVSGNLTAYVTPGSDWKYTSYAYDALGRVVTQTNPDGTTISHDYSTPWRDQDTDQRGYKKNSYYDALQRLVKVEELDAFNVLYSKTTYSYDVLGNLVEVKDNNNNTSTMGYDWLSRKTSMSDPDMGSWSYTYDNNGNIKTQTDAKGSTTTFTYDALNRLLSKSCNGTSGNYTYDSTLNGNLGKGLRTGMSGASGNTTYSYAYIYDARGRLITETDTIDSGNYTTQYGYDSADRLGNITYPTGERVTQGYNGRGWPNTLSGNVTGTIVSSALYNNLGQYTEINLGNNVIKTTFGYYGGNGSSDISGGYYNKLYEIKSTVSGNIRQDMKYSWDASGNLVQRVDSDNYTETFTYDFLNRLTSDTGATPPGGGNDSNTWYPMSSTPNTLRSVWASSPSDVFAVGDSNTIVHYDGSAWTPMSGATAGLYGVWGTSSSDVFAVGSGGVINHYDGSSWSAMSSPTGNTLYGVWGNSSSSVFAVGAGGTILRYNGSTWSTMNSGTNYNLYGVWGTSSYVFAVGAYGTILRYNGSSWSTMTSGTSDALRGVWGSSGSDIFIVGNNNVILHSNNNGTTWSAMSGFSGYFESVWGTSSSDVFAVGYYDVGVIYHYNGSAWSQMDCGNLLSYIHGVWGSSSQDVFAVAESGEGIVLHYSGSKLWKPMNNVTSYALVSVWGSSPSDVFAVGPYNTIVHYNGTAWANMSGATHWLYGVWGSSPSDVFAVGWAGTIDHYNGSSWTAMSSPTGNQLAGVWGNSSSNVFAVGASGTIVHYNGSTWSTMTSGTANDLLAVWGNSSTNIFAVGNSGTILRYNGTSWGNMTSGTNYNLYGVWGSSPSDVFAVGWGGGGGIILHYDGNTWSQQSLMAGNYFRSVWGTSSSDVFISGHYGVIYHYNGSAWSQMASGTSSITFWGIWGSSFEDVFAVGDNGTVLHYTMPPTETYAYDQIGNILFKNHGPYYYGSKPHAVIQLSYSHQYTYDANGNMITDLNLVTYSNRTITYDVWNRVVSVTDGGNTSYFYYDADGNRIKKIEGGQATVYIGKYYEKNTTTGNVTSYYYLGNRLVAFKSGSNLRYPLLDHLGSISVVTDSSGNTIGSMRYYPYGSARTSSGSFDTSEKFTGQRLDGTGLYYYGARYYDPAIGRFISADTIVPDPTNPQALNRYSYCFNNPLRYTDPTGHEPPTPPTPPVYTGDPVVYAIQLGQWTIQMSAWTIQMYVWTVIHTYLGSSSTTQPSTPVVNEGDWTGDVGCENGECYASGGFVENNPETGTTAELLHGEASISSESVYAQVGLVRVETPFLWGTSVDASALTVSAEYNLSSLSASYEVSLAKAFIRPTEDSGIGVNCGFAFGANAKTGDYKIGLFEIDFPDWMVPFN